jgi:ribonuclease HI
MKKESKWLWVHGHRGIKGNEISNLLARMELEHLFI